MDRKLKRFLIKSFAVLAVIHLAYFIYGYVKFVGLQKINIYTEFYRFKFYNDVSISHFFVTGLFLFFFVIFLLRNHSKKRNTLSEKLGIGIILLLVSFFSLTFLSVIVLDSMQNYELYCLKRILIKIKPC